jgi:hypothetical protein
VHGLVYYSIQLFVCDTYGSDAWVRVTRAAGLDFTEFESMMRYRENYAPVLLDAMSDVLRRRRADLMEDIGAFLVSHPGFEAVRRLLRFGGEDFVDFLHSLDDLSDSVRLAVADLSLPKVELCVGQDGQFNLACDAAIEGYGYVMMGVLRAMADDYGALAVLEHQGHCDGVETVSIMLVEKDFAEGRKFELAARVG